MSDEELTPEEQLYLKEIMTSGNTSPLPDEKHNVHNFLYKVAVAEDTTKLGYLKEEEIGTPLLTTRALKELSLISKKILNNDYFSDYFNNKSEIITSTSLSKGAKLLELAVINRKEIADVTKKPMKENKGWFKPKNKQQEVINE